MYCHRRVQPLSRLPNTKHDDSHIIIILYTNIIYYLHTLHDINDYRNQRIDNAAHDSAIVLLDKSLEIVQLSFSEKRRRYKKILKNHFI